jgi:hypothetical protein
MCHVVVRECAVINGPFGLWSGEMENKNRHNDKSGDTKPDKEPLVPIPHLIISYVRNDDTIFVTDRHQQGTMLLKPMLLPGDIRCPLGNDLQGRE